MNKLLTSLALCAATQASAATLELSFFYPESFANDPSKSMSQEVVGFYRSIEHGNALFADKGVNLTLKPSVFRFTTSWTDESVASGLNDMRFDTVVREETNVADIAVGLFTFTGTDVARAELTVASDYRYYPNVDRKLALGYGYSLGGSKSDGHEYILAHEVLHNIGVRHSNGAAFNNTGTAREDGRGIVCDSGVASLMSAAGPKTSYDKITLSGADDCQSPIANTVGFINEYAPMAEHWSAPIDNQTLTLQVTENANTQIFELVVTRQDTTADETATLYIAGGSVNTADNALAPIDVFFTAGSADSAPVQIPFTDLHPLFEQAHESTQSTYAVVIGQDEVQAESYDLLVNNTQWTPTPTEETDTGDSTTDTPTTTTGGGSGGGSVPLGGIALLMGLAALRRKA